MQEGIFGSTVEVTAAAFAVLEAFTAVSRVECSSGRRLLGASVEAAEVATEVTSLTAAEVLEAAEVLMGAVTSATAEVSAAVSASVGTEVSTRAVA